MMRLDRKNFDKDNHSVVEKQNRFSLNCIIFAPRLHIYTSTQLHNYTQMINFLELVKKRQSDRAYLDKPVEKEKLEKILEAGRLAPSACNAQPWKFIVVTDPEKRMKIADACSSRALGMNHFSKQAPVQLVLVEEKANFTSKFGGFVKQIHYPHLDLGIVASHICLAAADEGVGSCMMGWLNEKKIRSILDIPGNKKVVLVILLGYSTQSQREKKRKSIDEIVGWDHY